jgi:hypothetical protein
MNLQQFNDAATSRVALAVAAGWHGGIPEIQNRVLPSGCLNGKEIQ